MASRANIKSMKANVQFLPGDFIAFKNYTAGWTGIILGVGTSKSDSYAIRVLWKDGTISIAYSDWGLVIVSRV